MASAAKARAPAPGSRPVSPISAWPSSPPLGATGPHRFLYPVKALEYLAGGKPVLSTPLPDMVRFLSDYVILAEGPEEWAAAGSQLRGEAEAAQAQEQARRGQNYARGRSWDAMVGEMEGDLK